MEASLAICILAALLAMGACLQCEICAGPGTSCTGDLRTCPAGFDSCAIAVLEKTVVGVKSQNLTKTCATPIQCKAGLLSITYWNGETVRMSISCCVGDACRATAVPLPPADTKPNGRSCRGCIFSNSSYCQQGTIECGDDPFDILHGCATKSYCAMLLKAFDVVPGDSVVPVMDMCTTACETAGTGLAGLLLSALAGVLLLKLLSCLCGRARRAFLSTRM
ncbi:phospholipase A2 inhibitor gamma subunit B-like [Natator depressus]|uniref:phospholipase A2 inhibitor gamma subunit B-like n=1 Tax=Natator depressus TaxID=27790 RepID=UPI003EBD5495